MGVAYAGELDPINSYFREYLRDSDEFESQTAPYASVYKGKKDGYEFEVLVGEGSEGVVQVTIVLTEIPSADKTLDSLDEADIPSGYPVSEFPVINGAAVNNVSESDYDGKKTYKVRVYTDKTIKEILEFYDSTISNVKNKYKYSDSDSFTFSGETDSYTFEISGYKDHVRNVELINYSIYLYEK